MATSTQAGAPSLSLTRTFLNKILNISEICFESLKPIYCALLSCICRQISTKLDLMPTGETKIYLG